MYPYSLHIWCFIMFIHTPIRIMYYSTNMPYCNRTLYSYSMDCKQVANNFGLESILNNICYYSAGSFAHTFGSRTSKLFATLP